MDALVAEILKDRLGSEMSYKMAREDGVGPKCWG
jgi:hypothetical protein